MVNLSMAMCVSHNQMVKDESHLTAMDLEVPKPFTTSRGRSWRLKNIWGFHKRKVGQKMTSEGLISFNINISIWVSY